MDNRNDFDDDAVHPADEYMALLTSFEFCFVNLATFHSVFAYSDVLFGILQNKEYDMQLCLSSTGDFAAPQREKRPDLTPYMRTRCVKSGLPAGAGQGELETCAQPTSSCTTFSLS